MSTDQGQNHRQGPAHRAGRVASVSVEPLEGRSLLSSISYPIATSPPAAPQPIATSPPAMPSARTGHVAAPGHPTGIVAKSPHFYSFYKGPKLAELNAVKASGELSSGGNFTFTGADQGRINKAPAVFVWGIDRNGNLPPGPFTDRPNVKFDALVVVALNTSLRPSAMVIDMAGGTTTDLPSGSASIKGNTVSVSVPGSLLPSTGLAPSQYRFNYWPEDGQAPSSVSVASFAPETNTAQVSSR